MWYQRHVRVRPSTFVPFTLLAASVVLTAGLAARPMPGKPVAALFPPWWSATSAMTSAAAANGAVVRFGGFRTILILAAGDADLADRLRHAGAWLVLDAEVLGGCAAQP